MTTTPFNPIASLPLETITKRIVIVRKHKVLIDSDLAALYGVPTKRFNEQVKRNLDRFPDDFMFQLSQDEYDALRSQIATLKKGRGQHRKYLPFAFAEHGAIMAAMLLNSPRAIQVSVYVVRAFVQLREIVQSNQDVLSRLHDLEMKTDGLEAKHDNFSSTTRVQLKQVFDALRQLMTPPPEPPKRPIGFVTHG